MELKEYLQSNETNDERYARFAKPNVGQQANCAEAIHKPDVRRCMANRRCRVRRESRKVTRRAKPLLKRHDHKPSCSRKMDGRDQLERPHSRTSESLKTVHADAELSW